MNIIFYLLMITFCFLVWIEFSVTNIIFRPNSDGIKSLHITSLLNYLIHPFYNKTLWNIHTLDVNYALVLILSLVIYYLFYV